MTPTHRSRLAAALLGSALLSCAGGGPREDNQAPPAPAHPFVQAQPAPAPPMPPPPDAPLIRFRPAPPLAARPMPPMRVLGGPDVVVRRAPDRQGGPVLGVSVESSHDGLKVTGVTDVSLAASAGVKADDVLLRIGDVHIDSVADVRRALHGKRPGDEVKLAVIRAGEGIVELTGTVPEPPADADKGTDDSGAAHVMGNDGSRGGFLGVEVEDGAAEAGSGPDADQAAASAHGPGVVIAAVVANTAAWYAGLEARDRLLAIDGQALSSRADLVGAVASKEPGSMVELRYARDGQEHTTSVRLGEREPMGLLGNLRGPHGLRGFRLQGTPGFGPGPMGQMDLNLNDPGDMSSLFDDLHLQMQPGADAHSLRVQIDDGEMTIERDGKTETYRRGADGQWHSEDGSVVDDASRA